MNLVIRKTTHEDVKSVMPIFDIARKTIATLGIDQWQDGYPTESLIHEDVDADNEQERDGNHQIAAVHDERPKRELVHIVCG